MTIIMTSCDRWDLFRVTLDSFFKWNEFPYIAFHVHNDSIKAIPEEIKRRYANKNITWHEGTKRGLSAAWDYLVDLVETEYFFNLEDDWVFLAPTESAISYSIKSLSFCDQVWIRDERCHKQKITVQNIGDQSVRLIEKTKDWSGFTFNPGVRSMKKWKGWFSNGIGGTDEIDISRALMDNYVAISFHYPIIRHIGMGNHVKDFKI